MIMLEYMLAFLAASGGVLAIAATVDLARRRPRDAAREKLAEALAEKDTLERKLLACEERLAEARSQCEREKEELKRQLQAEMERLREEYEARLREAMDENKAALAVYEVMTDTGRVEPRVEKRFEVEGFDLENLLYRWIEELLITTDSEGLVFSRFRVEAIEKRGEEDYLLRGRAWGEPFDPERHEHRTIVKAMTYAMMEIRRLNSCWRLQFVVDI